jgi:Protein of unknown function (DUF669)
MVDYSGDSTGIDPDKPAFELIPEGDYTFQIKKAKATKSKNGHFMVECECEVINNIDLMGKTLKHYVTFLPKENPGAGIPIHFLKVIGQPWEGKYDVTVSNWEGETFLGTVQHEPFTTKKGKNVISAKISSIDYVEPTLTTKNKEESSIPF